MRASGHSKTSPRVVFVAGIAVVAMALEWIVLVAGTKLHEMIVGAGSVLATSAFLLAVRRSSTLDVRFRASDLARGWPVPWYILSDVYTITKVLFKDLFGIEKANSLYRVCGFKTSKHKPVLVARRVLATAYTTMGPNSIVIGIDYTQSRMLFHQLERSGVSEMTRSLGAQS